MTEWQEDFINLQKLFKRLEARVDSQEQILANLFMAYTELWAATEGLINEMVAVRTPEEQKEFLERFREFRKEIHGQLREAGGRLEGLDPSLTEAVGHMVDGQPTDPAP